ncbi:transposase [Synechocystis sp. LEGE 06083]|nr:transposase [Synechocystis sp. LEGE 06083]
MPAPYSIELKEKAVSAVEKGEKKSHVCRTLNISRNTLDLWIKKKKETESVAPKRDYERGPRPKIDNIEGDELYTRVGENLPSPKVRRLDN